LRGNALETFFAKFMDLLTATLKSLIGNEQG
jgi:hypothetical protein